MSVLESLVWSAAAIAIGVGAGLSVYTYTDTTVFTALVWCAVAASLIGYMEGVRANE